MSRGKKLRKIISINSDTLYGQLSCIPKTIISENQQLIDTILNEEFKEKTRPYKTDVLWQKLKDKAILINKSYSSAKLTKKIKKKESKYKLTTSANYINYILIILYYVYITYNTYYIISCLHYSNYINCISNDYKLAISPMYPV